jgi:microcystin-dependent protein
MKGRSSVAAAGSSRTVPSSLTYNLFTIVNSILVITMITVTGLAMWFAISALNQNTRQDERIETLTAKELVDVVALRDAEAALTADLTNHFETTASLLNATLCAKIMDTQTTLQNEIDVLFATLNITNITGMNLTNFILHQLMIDDVEFAALNASIVQERSDRTDNVTTIRSAVTVLDGASIKTINALSPLAGNIDINVVSPGLLASSVGHSITLSNTGVLTLNTLTPNMNNELFVAGTGGVQVNNTLTPYTITVDGSTLVAAITNLQAEDGIQDAFIANLTATVVAQQVQINSITMAEQTVAQNLNGTTLTFNMSITQLMSDVTTLQSMVSALQAQLANITAIATPTGTISPWGGSTTPPTGWLMCDGSMVAIATYMNLYNIVGCKFCAAMTCGATDFCLPDLRGRIPVAASTTVGSAFNVPAGTSNVGEEMHTLTTPELPSHTHSVTIGTGGDHAHSLSLHIGQSFDDTNGDGIIQAGEPLYGTGSATTIEQKCGCVGQSEAFTFNSVAGNPNRRIFYNKGTSPNNGAVNDGDHVHSASASSTGSGNSHNVVQPSVVVAAFIIKT